MGPREDDGKPGAATGQIRASPGRPATSDWPWAAGMVTRLPERHITGPDAIRRPSPAGRRLFYPVTRSASFRCARNRAGRPGETVIPACPGPDVPAAQRSDEWTGESSFRIVNSALWRIGRYGAMGCVGPRPGTPPSGSDSHFAGARAPASPGGPGIAGARCQIQAGPAPPPDPLPGELPRGPHKATAHRLTCVLAARNRVPGDPSDPDSLCRRAGQKEAAVYGACPTAW